MITILCPACRKQFQLPESQAGAKITCSGCGQRMLVPAGIEIYFFKHQGKRHGPVQFDQLQRHAQMGDLLPEDLVWASTTNTWKPARELVGLSLASVAPSPSSAITSVRLAQDLATVDAKPDSALEQARKLWLLCRDQLRTRSRKQLLMMGGVAGFSLVLLAILIACGFRDRSTVSTEGVNGDGVAALQPPPLPQKSPTEENPQQVLPKKVDDKPPSVTPKSADTSPKPVQQKVADDKPQPVEPTPPAEQKPPQILSEPVLTTKPEGDKLRDQHLKYSAQLDPEVVQGMKFSDFKKKYRSEE